MRPIVVIPARLAASRLPGKPLVQIGGVPMVVRVLRLAEAAGVGPVAVAAGDGEIVRVVEEAGGRAILTDPSLPSGSDRVQAALEAIDPAGRHDVIVNLQGDVPFFDPGLLEACVNLLKARSACDIATAAVEDASPAARLDENRPKAVLALDGGGRSGRALYFTRSALYGEGPVHRHVGVYAYRRDALRRFTTAPPSPLERRERLEQLRALELGLSIWAALVAASPLEVDTPADLAAAEARARREHAA